MLRNTLFRTFAISIAVLILTNDGVIAQPRSTGVAVPDYFPSEPANGDTTDAGRFRWRFDRLLDSPATRLLQSQWMDVGNHSAVVFPMIDSLVWLMEAGDANAIENAPLVGNAARAVWIFHQMKPDSLTVEAERLLWRMVEVGGDVALAALPHLGGYPRLLQEHYDDLLSLMGDDERSIRIAATRVFVTGSPPMETSDAALPALMETLDSLIAQERAGQSVLSPTPYFGAGPENETAGTRKAIADLAATWPVWGKRHLIAMIIDNDPAAGCRAAAVSGLMTGMYLRPFISEHDAAPLYQRAIEDPSAAVKIESMEGVRYRHITRLKPSVAGLVSHHRRSVREKAVETLMEFGDTLGANPEPPAAWPEGLREALVELGHRGLTNPSGMIRARAAIYKRDSWGNGEVVADRLGWLRLDPAGAYFIDDDLEEGKVTADSTIKQTDFEQELEDRIVALATADSISRLPREYGARRQEPTFFENEEEQLGRDLFRIVWALQLGKEEQAFQLSNLILQRFDSDDLIIEHLANEVGWFLYLHALDTFIVAADSEAKNYASRIELLAPYQKPQRAIEHYVRIGRVLVSEIASRGSADFDTTKSGELATWIALLPEARGRQWGQPGGATVLPGEPPFVGEHVVDFGPKALPVLYEHFWDERPIRGVEFWRDFARDRHLITCGEAAQGFAWAISRRHKLAIPGRFVEDIDDLKTEDERRGLVRAFRVWFEEAVPESLR